jgi:hypothetical protein
MSPNHTEKITHRYFVILEILSKYEVKIYTKVLYKGGSCGLLRILSKYIKNSVRTFAKLKSIELYSFETMLEIISRWADL